MSFLDNIFGTKKASDLTRKELEKLAVKHKVDFTKETKDAELKKQLEFVIEKQKPTGKTIKIKFLLSPTGKFGLGYNAGETAQLPEAQAIELIEAKYAVKVK